MFGRRRRTQSNPPLNASTADPSAATAALSAFRKQASNAALSSAAASAALRSRPTTPVSVADVQTKRILRRVGSNSSAGSSVAGGVGRPTLERRGSNASMSQRSFRDPSPVRSAASPAPELVPPVPALPKHVNKNEKAKGVQRRASSMGVLGRMASPNPVAPSLPVERVASPQIGHERRGSRGSVNFSYPTISRPMSAIDQRSLTAQSPPPQNSHASDKEPRMIYDPNSRRLVPAVELMAIEQDLRDTASKPVKKKKKQQITPGAGFHLAEGTVGGRPRGTAVDAVLSMGTPDTSKASSPAQSPVRARPARPNSTPAPSLNQAQGSNANQPAPAAATTTPPPAKRTSMLEKKPSMIREESDEDAPRDQAVIMIDRQVALKKLDPSARSNSASPAASQHSTSPSPHGQNPATADPPSKPIAAPVHDIPAEQSQPNDPVTAASPPTTTNPPARVHSISPSRTTRFATADTSKNLTVRHSPPARSISPRKSALKSTSPRGLSPASDGTSHTIGDGSDSTLACEDGNARRKSVRVSFDDEHPAVIGTAASPVTTDSPRVESPQGRRGWLSSFRKNTDHTIPDADEEAEMMSPRPMLPSFDSVRERRSRDTDERPLVRPGALSHTESPPSVPLSDDEEMLGLSQDHNVGALLAQDFKTKETYDAKLPLPPEVTSRESGVWSDSESNASSDAEPETFAEPDTGAAVPPSLTTIHEDIKEDDERTIASAASAEEVPAIAVTKATPTIAESQSRSEWPDIPGGFPSGSDGDRDETTHAAEPDVKYVRSAAAPQPISSPSQAPIPVATEAESTDDDSIYSDAAEDLSDLEGDGFMSLDAVLERTLAANADSKTNSKAASVLVSHPVQSVATSSVVESGGAAVEASITTNGPPTQPAPAPTTTIANHTQTKQAAKPKQKKKKIAVAPALETSALNAAPSRPMNRTMRSSPPEPAVPNGINRKTLRAQVEQPAGQSMRVSMRTNGAARNGPMHTTAASPPPPVGRQQPLAANTKLIIDPNQVDMLVKQLSAKSAGAAMTQARNLPAGPAAAPKLIRRGSGDSDSSFKRSRPSSSGFGMRRSMRDNQDQASVRSLSPQRPSTAKRFSLRSMSPSRSPNRPSSSSSATGATFGMGQRTMRGSMRDAQTPTLRGSTESGKASTRMRSLGRPKAASKSKSFASRFADSSDEEDNAPAYRSRFDDSSDDDVPSQPRRTLAPVRGIPQTTLEADESSDLPDSDDEPAAVLSNGTGYRAGVPILAAPPKNANTLKKSGTIQRSGSGREAMALSSPQVTSPNSGRRSSFLGRLGRKKEDPSSKIRKSELESAARRDTPLERSRSDLLLVRRQESDLSTPTQSPILHKHQPPMGTPDVEDWPLPASPVTVADPSRPQSPASPSARLSRAGMGNRRSSAPQITSNGFSPPDEGKKKKKFNMLRKMFKLDA